MIKKILLTGASGFIGSHLCQYLTKANHQVYTISRSELHSVSPNHRHYPGTFYNKQDLDKLPSNIDCIIHSAAMRGEGLGSWDSYLTVNVEGTRILAQWALDRGVKKFIFISTAGVYGTIPQNSPACEEGPFNADMFYHKSKWQAENILRETISKKMALYILRPTTIYGKYDDGFIHKLIEMVRDKRFMLIRKPLFIHFLNVSYLVLIIGRLIDFSEKQLLLNVADESPVELQTLVDEIHLFFYQKKYPGYLRLPAFIFYLAEKITAILRMQQLNTSFKLISYHRSYDVKKLQALCLTEPVKTESSIKRLLESEYRN